MRSIISVPLTERSLSCGAVEIGALNYVVYDISAQVLLRVCLKVCCWLDSQVAVNTISFAKGGTLTG
jgi:hypothetical protein